MNIAEIIKKLYERFNDDEVPALASQLAYSLITSFFPFLIFLMAVVGFSSLKSTDVLQQLNNVLPESAYKLVSKTIKNLIEAKQTNLLSFGFIFTIWSAASGLQAIINGLNKAYDEKETRSFIKIAIISILFTFILIMLIILLISFLVFGQIIGKEVTEWYGYPEIVLTLWNIVRYMIIIATLLILLSLMYRYMPCKKLSLKETLPGACFSTVAWIIASMAFAFYVNNFGNYSVAYGSVGAIFILLTWLYLISIIIIIGGELNATLALDKEVRKTEKKTQ